MTEPHSEYNRGRLDGGIETRLAGHDKHLEAINGSLGKIAEEMHQMRLTLQALGDQAIARDATVITTAAALKDADAARRDSADQRWSPWQKGIAVIIGLGALVGLYFALKGG